MAKSIDAEIKDAERRLSNLKAKKKKELAELRSCRVEALGEILVSALETNNVPNGIFPWLRDCAKALPKKKREQIEGLVPFEVPKTNMPVVEAAE